MTQFKTLESERIRLRAIEPEDLDLLYLVENDPSSWEVSHNKMSYSRFFLKNYLESLTGDIFLDQKVRFVIEDKATAVALGIIDLYDISAFNSRAEIGIIIFEEFRGQAYGREATELLLDYAFNSLFLHQIYATSSAKNAAAMAMFESCGFEKTACLKNWQKAKEGFDDVFLLQCFAPF